MPPKRRNTADASKDAASDLTNPGAKQKKSDKRSALPKLGDSDVVTSLGSTDEDDLVLYRKDLSRMCEYSDRFDEVGWPERFALRPTADVSECLVVAVSCSRAGVSCCRAILTPDGGGAELICRTHATAHYLGR